jgi:DnaK suppressor protein
VEQLEHARQDSQPVSLDNPIGRVTRIDAIQQQNMASASKARIHLRLKHIEDALKRIAEDEYGICTACGEDIEAKRLHARPETPLCLKCQEELES